MAHLNGEMLAVQGLHLMKGISLQLLGLDPHSHAHNLLKQTIGGLGVFFPSPFKSTRVNIHTVIKDKRF